MTDTKLRELAEAATPGPWEAECGTHVARVVCDTQAPLVTCGIPDEEPDERDRANAAFIAATNPTAIIALLDDNDRLRSEIEAADARMLGVLDGTFAVGDGTAQREIERLRAELDAALKAKDEACDIGHDALTAAHDSATSGHAKWRSKLQRLARLRSIGTTKNGGEP